MRENLGIVVQYKVKIRLFIAGALGGELSAELPFTLTHAKPIDLSEMSTKPTDSNGVDEINSEELNGITNPVDDVDLIQFDRLFFINILLFKEKSKYF